MASYFHSVGGFLFYNAMTSTWYSWSESKQEYTVVSASSAPVETRDEPKESKKTPSASRVHATISSAPVVHKPLQPSVKEASVDDEVAAPKYRDRANERRTLHDKQSVVASSVPAGKITGGRVRTPRT